MGKKIAWNDEARAQLRAIDYRLRFHDFGHAIDVTAVKHRREAHR